MEEGFPREILGEEVKENKWEPKKYIVRRRDETFIFDPSWVEYGGDQYAFAIVEYIGEHGGLAYFWWGIVRFDVNVSKFLFNFVENRIIPVKDVIHFNSNTMWIYSCKNEQILMELWAIFKKLVSILGTDKLTPKEWASLLRYINNLNVRSNKGEK